MFVMTDSQENFLHKTNPVLKLFSMVVLFFMVIIVHDLNFMVYFTLLLLLVFLFLTGQEYKRLFLFSLPFIVIFVSTASSMILFGKGETTLFKYGLIHITEESLYRGLHLGFRSLSFALLGLTFSLTTKPVYLFYSLMQQLKLNPKYAYSFMAAVRLLPMMIEEFQIIRDAQKVRGGLGTNGVIKRIMNLKIIIIPLLSGSIRKAFRIAVAMESKKFETHKKRTFYYRVGFSKNDVFFVLLIFILNYVSFELSQITPLFAITDVR